MRASTHTSSAFAPFRTRLGAAASPDLVLDGPPRLILGLLSAHLTPAEACDHGLTITGDPAVLRRLLPEPAQLG